MTGRPIITNAEFIARRARLRGDIYRTARSEFRANAKVADFKCPPGAPGSDKQPFAWADSYPFLIVIAVFAGFVWFVRSKGWV